jgi:hypothetical protein
MDGMVALTRYVQLNPLHAHTNYAPNPKEKEWYSRDCADSILIATKPYSGATKLVDLNAYTCIPPNQEQLRDGFFPQPPERNSFMVRAVGRVYRFVVKHM